MVVPHNGESCPQFTSQGQRIGTDGFGGGVPVGVDDHPCSFTLGAMLQGRVRGLIPVKRMNVFVMKRFDLLHHGQSRSHPDEGGVVDVLSQTSRREVGSVLDMNSEFRDEGMDVGYVVTPYVDASRSSCSSWIARPSDAASPN